MDTDFSRRQNRVREEIMHKAGEFLAREASNRSLITVTRTDISSDLKNTTIFVSVLPKEREEEALAFLKRSRTDFHDFLKSKTVLRNVPTVDFRIDVGEINRQQVDDALRENK
jgi:ribosome-binding factor A